MVLAYLLATWTETNSRQVKELKNQLTNQQGALELCLVKEIKMQLTDRLGLHENISHAIFLKGKIEERTYKFIGIVNIIRKNMNTS